MSFWNLSDSNEKLDTSGSFESGGGDPIPDNTQVKAAIDEAKWDEYEGERYISLRWNVLAPVEYKGRKVFQKVKVFDAKKADKAKKMLAAIAVNAGGGLLKVSEPSDQDLQKHLMNKPMALLLKVWAIDKEKDGTPIPYSEQKKGNWISAVSPLKKKEPEPEPVEPINNDDDIGF